MMRLIQPLSFVCLLLLNNLPTSTGKEECRNPLHILFERNKFLIPFLNKELSNKSVFFEVLLERLLI